MPMSSGALSRYAVMGGRLRRRGSSPREATASHTSRFDGPRQTGETDAGPMQAEHRRTQGPYSHLNTPCVAATAVKLRVCEPLMSRSQRHSTDVGVVSCRVEQGGRPLMPSTLHRARLHLHQDVPPPLLPPARGTRATTTTTRGSHRCPRAGAAGRTRWGSRCWGPGWGPPAPARLWRGRGGGTREVGSNRSRAAGSGRAL